MEFLIRTQTLVFIQACLLGAILGALYDVFKITRMVFAFPKLMVTLSDIVYSVIVIVFTFSFVLGFNDGRLRAFILLGEFLGMTLYFCTISRGIILIVRALIIILKKICTILFKIIFMPIIWLIKFIGMILTKIYVFSRNNLQKIEKNLNMHLKNAFRLLYNKIIGFIHVFKKVEIGGSKKTKEE